MRRLVTSVLALAIMVPVAGCALLPQSCPAARLDGNLFADPSGTLLVKEDVNGTIWTVRWPDGYEVREVDDRVVVTDVFGGIKAGDGDRIGIGGGVDPTDETRWEACGNMDSLRR